MTGTLTRMAERAIGAKPVAMPLVRPIFAAPQKLAERDLEKPLSMETPSVASHQNQTHVQEQAVPPPMPRNMDERNNDPGEKYPHLESRVQRLDRIQQEERRQPRELFREPAAAPRKLTLRDAIDHIYGPREALGHQSPAKPPIPARPSIPSAPLPSLRGMQHENQEPIEDKREQRELPRTVEPQMERPRPAEAQRTRAIEDSSFRPATLPLQQQAKIRVDSGPAIPDVHVSIGRIELKAAPQPAPPTQVRTPSRRPHLSLSDYLARRRGGRP